MYVKTINEVPDSYKMVKKLGINKWLKYLKVMSINTFLFCQ